ncbi:MAG: hypothetical protein K2Q10_13615, partial [Rhodospirillales bacterium]|nr:hypothetical protein [Rhodospirillales bacterium]
MSGSSIGTVSNPDAFERYVPDDTTVGTRVKPFAAGDEPSFSDFIDVINPLQHIPIISTIYRSLTGDEIGSAARIAGGTLYGGPLGLAFAVADVAVEDASGLAIEGHALALLRGEDAAAGATQMAQAAPAQPQAAPVQLASAAQDSSLPPPVAAAP